MSRERFVEAITQAIVSLPQDLKAVIRIVEDPDIDDESRIAAAGSLLHVLSASNAIPGARGLLAYVDDVLVLRLVVEGIESRSPDAMAVHRDSFPELFEPLRSQLAAARDYLGELMSVLEQAAGDVKKLSFQGHTASQCVSDPESSNWLYDAVQEAIVQQLEFDEDEVARQAKRIDEIIPHLKLRADTVK